MTCQPVADEFIGFFKQVCVAQIMDIAVRPDISGYTGINDIAVIVLIGFAADQHMSASVTLVVAEYPEMFIFKRRFNGFLIRDDLKFIRSGYVV